MSKMRMLIVTGVLAFVLSGGAVVMLGDTIATAAPLVVMHPAKPFDVQFIDGMMVRHQRVIKLADQALQQSNHEELRLLAQHIIKAQTQELETLTTWRARWYPDLPPTEGMSMSGMGMRTNTNQPFDQRFINAVIAHHQGTIEMAKMAQQMAQRPEIKRLAAEVITAQQADIEQLQGWLQVGYSTAQ